MIRPSFHPSPHQRAVGRNLAFDLVAAVGVGVTTAMVTALLPTIARRGGLEPIGIAALVAAPFVGNLLGAFAGRIGPRTPAQLALLRAVGAAALLVLLLVPTPLVMIVASLVFWVSLSFGSPFHLRLWTVIYPARLVGRMVGVVGMGRAAASGGAALAGGLLADRLGGPSAVAMAGLVGIVCAVGYVGLRARSTERPPTYTARQSFEALRSLPILSRITMAQAFYGGGLIAAAPLFALVHVDRLDLSLADVGVIGVLAALSTTVSFPVWGALSDRLGSLVVIRLGSTAGLAGLLAYAVAPDVTFLWFAAIATGIATASIDLGFASAMSEFAPLAARAPASAGLNAITGARGIVAAFLMSALLQAGLVDVTLGLALCAATSAVGVVMYARLRPDPSSADAPMALPGAPAGEAASPVAVPLDGLAAIPAPAGIDAG
ncbi:MAG: MFS transporter [Candidatus Limnocylindria bacterium]